MIVEQPLASPGSAKYSKRFYLMYLGNKEQNCIIHFLIMQQTNRGLLTTRALNDCYEAMVASKHLLICSLLRKKLNYFYSIYLGKSFKHPSKEQSYTLVAQLHHYYLYCSQKRLNFVDAILPHSVLHCHTIRCKLHIVNLPRYCIGGQQ